MNSSESADITIEIRDSNNAIVRVIRQRSITLQAVAVFQRTMTQRVGASLPAGDYSLVFTVNAASGSSTSSFPFTKSP
jgi:flagellar hook assembly protein FlgD